LTHPSDQFFRRYSRKVNGTKPAVARTRVDPRVQLGSSFVARGSSHRRGHRPSRRSARTSTRSREAFAGIRPGHRAGTAGSSRRPAFLQTSAGASASSPDGPLHKRTPGGQRPLYVALPAVLQKKRGGTTAQRERAGAHDPRGTSRSGHRDRSVAPAHSLQKRGKGSEANRGPGPISSRGGARLPGRRSSFCASRSTKLAHHSARSGGPNHARPGKLRRRTSGFDQDVPDADRRLPPVKMGAVVDQHGKPRASAVFIVFCFESNGDMVYRTGPRPGA